MPTITLTQVKVWLGACPKGDRQMMKRYMVIGTRVGVDTCGRNRGKVRIDTQVLSRRRAEDDGTQMLKDIVECHRYGDIFDQLLLIEIEPASDESGRPLNMDALIIDTEPVPPPPIYALRQVERR